MNKENDDIKEENKGFYLSPMGLLEIKASKNGLTSCRFIENANQIEINEHDNALIARAKEELKRYFSGELRQFTVPLDERGTKFQRQVWEVIRQIPYGVRKSYSDIARELGNPLVIRAAATANGKNPLLLFIPCHRVIGKGGEMVGYSGGLAKKRDLLDFEDKIANGIQTLF
ncbi:MAG: methylated-DNA--[protein]-cysteine S-methyltransferase [Spirosomataceae bacterium]